MSPSLTGVQSNPKTKPIFSNSASWQAANAVSAPRRRTGRIGPCRGSCMHAPDPSQPDESTRRPAPFSRQKPLSSPAASGPRLILRSLPANAGPQTIRANLEGIHSRPPIILVIVATHAFRECTQACDSMPAPSRSRNIDDPVEYHQSIGAASEVSRPSRPSRCFAGLPSVLTWMNWRALLVSRLGRQIPSVTKTLSGIARGKEFRRTCPA